MAIAVGIDVAKEVHWACIKVKETGQLLRSRRGMGATLTAEFLAEAGGTHRFPTPTNSPPPPDWHRS